MMRTRLGAAAATLLACGPALAAPQSAMTARQEALLDRSRLAMLEVGERVTLEDFPLDQGQSVDLELERFSVLAPDAQVVVVDEFGVERPAGDLGVVLLKGRVGGDDGSAVFVSLSPYGTQGYVQRAAGLHSISSGRGGDLADDLGLRVADTAGVSPAALGAICGAEDGDLETDRFAQFGEAPEGYAMALRAGSLRVAEIAIDTDYQFTQSVFNGNTAAANAYIQTLVGAISQIYERDVNTRLTVTYSRVFAANNDPYPDSSADSRLDHLKSHWDASMKSVSRDAVHMLSGLNPSWAGRAYVSALCQSGSYGGYDYGVSTRIRGSFPDPIQNHNWNNWDLMVVAHELGHNFGTGHTHSSSWYNPVIDGCGNGDCSKAYGGTIMSYCHVCSGGMGNIKLAFHPRVIDNIRYFLDYYATCVTEVAGDSCGAGDTNADGLVNVDDVQTFATAAVAHDMDVVDCDRNGTYNVDDVQCFVTAFLAGCD